MVRLAVASSASPPAPPPLADTSSRPDWRRAFQDLPREHDFEPLRVEGRLPEDLRGTLYFNGPSLFSAQGRPYRHWFDGMARCASTREAPGARRGWC